MDGNDECIIVTFFNEDLAFSVFSHTYCNCSMTSHHVSKDMRLQGNINH